MHAQASLQLGVLCLPLAKAMQQAASAGLSDVRNTPFNPDALQAPQSGRVCRQDRETCWVYCQDQLCRNLSSKVSVFQSCYMPDPKKKLGLNPTDAGHAIAPSGTVTPALYYITDVGGLLPMTVQGSTLPKRLLGSQSIQNAFAQPRLFREPLLRPNGRTVRLLTRPENLVISRHMSGSGTLTGSRISHLFGTLHAHYVPCKSDSDQVNETALTHHDTGSLSLRLLTGTMTFASLP